MTKLPRLVAALALTVLVSIAWGQPAATPSASSEQAKPAVQPDDAAPALQSQQRFCEAEADQLKQAVEKLKAGKAELAARLAKAQAEAEQKKKEAPAAAAPVAVAPAQLAQEVKLVDTLEQAVATHQAAAVQALTSAARERDPQMQRFYLKEATQRMESARNALARAESIVVTADPQYKTTTTSSEPRTTPLKTDWPTLQLLRQTASEGEHTGRFDNRGGLETFAPAAVTPVRQTSTRFFEEPPTPSRYDAAQGTLRLSDGRSIDVAPLQRAVAQVRPEAARQPLFVPDANAGGALRPAPAVRELLANPQERDKLKAVGGVALDVTFDSLDFARVADFRGRGARSWIERPVLLSLGQLYARLAPYAASQARWAALPEALRHPGGMVRVHGFVLDPQRQDIFLLGAASDAAGEHLDVDALILALRAVWSEGQIPAVSLDPLPDDPAGPQYPRVHNVPPDSVVARIMLDADYAMKRIMLGDLDTEVEGYVSAADLLAESNVQESRDRFWFHPMPLTINSLRASPSGRTWLLDAGLQVLTENQWLRDGVLTDSGQPNTVAMEAAREFSANLEQFESAPAIAPPRIFVRLHGVLDAVAVARLLRELRIGYPVLDAFVRLPYRQLTAAQERVPAFYPGIFVTREGDGQSLYLAGGVQLRLQPRAAAVDRYADPVASALEGAADGFASDRFAQRVTFSVPLARPNEEDALAAREEMREGRHALEAGDYDEAVARFRDASQREPLDVDAWIQLARAESLADNPQGARDAVARALELEPSDPLVRVTAFEVERRTDPRHALQALDQATRLALGQDYVAAAFAALHEGNRQQALRLSSAALELSNDNAEALLVRFFARPETETSARRRDVARAIRAYREALGKADGAPVQRRLAFALTLAATQRTTRVTNNLLAALATPEKLFDTMEAINDLDAAAADAREARQFDPDLPLAPAVEAMARGVRLPLLRASGLEAESAAAHRLADETIARFPNHPIGYYARAVLYLVDEDPQSARTALDGALQADPTNAPAFAMRALVNNALGDCAASQRDFQRARALRMPLTEDDERALRDCTPH